MNTHSRSRRIGSTHVTPKKSLGQNFLVDAELSRWITDQVQPDDAPVIVEIGPGLGALTEHLIGRPRELILIEKDTRLASSLLERFAADGAISVRNEDASDMDLRSLYRYGDVRVVGNLPYSMGGEILKRVLTAPTPVTCAVFMLQKEVCNRLCARQEDDAYGGLSLLVQKDWDVDLLMIVPPEVFNPKPKVDSAIVRFTPRKPGTLPVFDRAVFDRLVKVGFSQRRKQMKNLMPEPPGGWAALVEHLGVPVSVRAEELTLAKWVDLTRWYEGRKEQDRGQRATELFDVVNEQNVVIGQKPRGEVHAEGLRHRAVHVFVVNKRGQVYLQKRSHLKDVHPLTWDSSASGHLDVGESYANCAIRELREELGIEVPATQKVADIPATERTGMEFVELHAAEHGGPMRYAPDEIECGEWFSPEQIDEWVAARPEDFATGFLECWKAWKSR
jgi:16S rRNA (adenine1518-N6/adenine1519-N6)-dimethyltransferase